MSSLKTILLLVTLVVTPLFTGPLQAQTETPPDEASLELIPLDTVIRSTIAHNLSYQAAAIDPEIARQFLTRAESDFDSEVFANGRLAQSEQTTTFSQTTGTSSDNRSWNLGVRKRLAYGTSVTAQTNLDRRSSNAGVNTSNLSQNADFSLSVRQPLMSGFGRAANTANIESARAGVSASESAFREIVLNLLAETEQAYWTVSRWQEQLELNHSNLEVAEALLAEARERERVGLATTIDVLQAEASRAQFIEEIISTRRSLGDAFDQLTTYMGRLAEIGEINLDQSFRVERLPELPPVETDFNEVWNRAMAEDPALARQEASIAQREWDRIAARNSTKPSLDLVLSGAYSGLDDQKASDAYDSALDRDGHSWAVGLEFSMPWGMRGEKANLRVTESRLEQEMIRYQELKQSLFQDVRAAWRNLQTVQQSLEAARLTVSLQEASFEREKIKYEQGLSAFRDVLEVQRDLDQARIRLLQAKYNNLNAEISLNRLTGQLFERHGLSGENLPVH